MCLESKTQLQGMIPRSIAVCFFIALKYPNGSSRWEASPEFTSRKGTGRDTTINGIWGAEEGKRCVPKSGCMNVDKIRNCCCVLVY